MSTIRFLVTDFHLYDILLQDMEHKRKSKAKFRFSASCSLPSVAHSREELSRFNPLVAQMCLHRADGHFLAMKDPGRQGRLGPGRLEHLGEMLHLACAA